ncbi:MAG: autotransporter outer membrane beta-barrel domain-containing protein [Nitrospirota bacterium]
MNQLQIHRFVMALIAIAAIAMLAPSPSSAAGTASGTAIGNAATVSYQVGGVNQTPYTAPTSTFVVDTKVIFNVSKVDASPVGVAPGSTARVLRFNLRNDSNAIIRFQVAGANLASASTITFGVTGYSDNQDVSAFTACIDADNSFTCNGAETALGNVAVDTTVSVVIQGDIPIGATSGQVLGALLTATAVDAGGTPLAESATDDPAVADIVLADGAGTDDAARGGTYTDRSAYTIAAAIVSVTKNAVTIWDPYNFHDGGAGDTQKPKAIPGALVRYTVTISNDASASSPATLTTVTDSLSASLAIDPDLLVAANAAVLSPESAAGSGFKATWTGGARPSFATPKYYTTTSSADGIDHSGVNPGGSITATMATVLPVEGAYTTAGELQPGDAVTITFNVIVQ